MAKYTNVIITSISIFTSTLFSVCNAMENNNDIEIGLENNIIHHAYLIDQNQETTEQNIVNQTETQLGQGYNRLPVLFENVSRATRHQIYSFSVSTRVQSFNWDVASSVTSGIILYGLYYAFNISLKT